MKLSQLRQLIKEEILKEIKINFAKSFPPEKFPYITKLIHGSEWVNLISQPTEPFDQPSTLIDIPLSKVNQDLLNVLSPGIYLIQISDVDPFTKPGSYEDGLFRLTIYKQNDKFIIEVPNIDPLSAPDEDTDAMFRWLGSFNKQGNYIPNIENINKIQST